MVTKKDFEAVAKIVKIICEQWPGRMGGAGAPAGFLVNRLAGYFAEQDPNFNREKFIKACGL